MKQTVKIKLSELSELVLDEETTGFRPNWDNIILMTAYDKKRTFILTWDGRYLVLPRPLGTVLEQFAQDNDIADYERQALYDMIGVYKGRGYIAGHNRLVPTCGTTNDSVVYYVARRLAGREAIEDGQMVEASFRGRKHQLFRVVIDTSYKTFMNLLEATDEVAGVQLDILEWRMHSYRVKKVNKRDSVRFYAMYGNHRLKSRDLRRRWIMMLVRRVIRDYCTEEECAEIERLIKHYIEK